MANAFMVSAFEAFSGNLRHAVPRLARVDAIGLVGLGHDSANVRLGGVV